MFLFVFFMTLIVVMNIIILDSLNSDFTYPRYPCLNTRLGYISAMCLGTFKWDQ